LKQDNQLKIGLGAVLAFVGVKMLLTHTAYKIDTLLSLAVVAGILLAGVLAGPETSALCSSSRPPFCCCFPSSKGVNWEA